MKRPAWEDSGRAARVVVDLGVIESNVSALRRTLTGSADLMAVVKADGYGHGAIEVGKTALRAGASWLGVATLEEAVELRTAGISAPILLLSPCQPQEAAHAGRIDVAVTAGSEAFIRELTELDEHCLSGLQVHLKIDTGMNRFGVTPGDAVQAALALNSIPGIELGGVSTHFARADETDRSAVDSQARTFSRCVEAIESAGIDAGTRHAANSSALIRFPELHFDMVRTGIAMYGIRPSPDVRLPDGMKPAMRVECRSQRVWEPGRGSQVGYGGTYATSATDRLILLPLGYGDGYSRTLSNRGWAGFQDHRLDVVGRVSMDQTVVRAQIDVDIQVGDCVDIMGAGNDAAPTAEDLADLVGTIPYETVVAFGLRLPRIFVQDRVVVHNSTSEPPHA